MVIGAAAASERHHVMRLKTMRAPAYPELLLADTPWDFGRQREYGSRGAFEAAVRDHLIEGELDPDECWRPDEVVLVARRVHVRYFRDVPGDSVVPRVVALNSDGPAGFAAGELLFKLHNAVVAGLRDAAHRYFEGLELEAGSEVDAPTYELRQGS